MVSPRDLNESETPEYTAFVKASRAQRDTEARETLERAILTAQEALQEAVLALEEYDKTH